MRDRPAAPADRHGSRVATTVLLLGVVSLLTDVSSEMVAAVLPLYLTAQVGLGFFAYGVVDGLYQGVSAVVRIAGGYAGDRGGRPKRIALIGYGVSALSRIALLPAQGFAAVTAVITADRLGKGLRTAPRDAMIAGASDPGALGRAFGVHRTLDTIGAALGPLVAFALLMVVPGSYDSVFVASFAFGVIGFAVLVLFVPDLRTGSAARMRLRAMVRELSGVRLRRPLIATALLGLLTVGDGFLYLAVQQRDDLAAGFFPLLYVGTNVAYLALALPLGRLADRIGRGRVLVGGHVALVAAYVLAGGPFTGIAPTIGVLLLLGAFYAATDGVLAALVSRLVSESARGSGIAAAQTVVALTRFAAAIGFGGLWVLIGRADALLLVAALLAAALPVAWWLLRPTEAHG
ncbi:MFS transporter [Actinoplanes sp. NPDC051859]|uniref:MFS transporter n=1 Tax=Actinoplanes sp. NPDC051859 TaxID=3363909 RepID=UPI0037A69C38